MPRWVPSAPQIDVNQEKLMTKMDAQLEKMEGMDLEANPGEIEVPKERPWRKLSRALKKRLQMSSYY
jgi:hypothetical protein